MRRWLFLALLSAPVHLALAQDSTLPPILDAGMRAYRDKGADSALTAWLRGWDRDAAEVARSQFHPVFATFDSLGGRFEGYDAFATVNWGPHAKRVYLVLRYERRVIYGRMDAFLASDDWRALNLTFNTDPANVFPPALLVPDAALH
jgi:hypothetical protein